MSKFMIENAQIQKASTFQPIVQGDTPEVANIADSLGKIAEWHDEIETSKTDIGNMQDDIADHDTAITELQIDAGKNLIDMSNPSYQKGDIVDNHDGTYTLGGTGTWLRMDFNVDVTPGQIYRFKCDFTNVSGPKAVFAIRDGGQGDKLLVAKDPLKNNTGIDEFFTPTENFVKVVFAPVESGTSNTGYMTVNPVLYKVSDTEAATRYLVDTSAKNIFDIDAEKTAYHATYAVSGQNITVTSSGNYARVAIPAHAKAGNYKFSCGVTYSSGSVDIRFAQNADSSGTIADKITVSTTGNVSRDITLDTDMDFYVVLYTNTTSSSATNEVAFNNIMICSAEDYAISSKFVPYAPTNRELYDEISSIKDGTNIDSFSDVETALSEKLNTSDIDTTLNSTSTNPVQNKAVQAPIARLIDTGAKNLLDVRDRTWEYQGISYVAKDGIASASGTATGTPSRASFGELLLPPGDYVLSGCPANGSDTTHRLDVYASTDGKDYLLFNNKIDYGAGVSFTLLKQWYIRPTAHFQNGYVASNLVFKPMICTKAAWDISHEFEPYALPNTDLTKKVLGVEECIAHYVFENTSVAFYAKQYSAFIIFGLVQGFGRICAFVTVNSDNTTTYTSITSGTQPSSLSFSYNRTNYKLTITAPANSALTVVKSIPQ